MCGILSEDGEIYGRQNPHPSSCSRHRATRWPRHSLTQSIEDGDAGLSPLYPPAIAGAPASLPSFCHTPTYSKLPYKSHYCCQLSLPLPIRKFYLTVRKRYQAMQQNNAAWPDVVYGVGELSCCLHDDSLALIVHLYALSRGVNGLAVGGVHHDDGELALL